MTDPSAQQLDNVICIASWGNHGLFAQQANQPIHAEYLRRVGRPICGDRVQLNCDTSGQWYVQAIQPRSSEFARSDKRGRAQIIAVNVDQAVVVIAAQPAPSRDLLDRYLVACELARINPLLVLNKIDLDLPVTSDLQARLEDYAKLGYQQLSISTKTGQGMAGLAAALSAQTSLIVGQSGVGKSSMINRLIPDLALQTQALSTVTGKGTHTTTISQLYFMPEGDGRIIDSPGVWEYGLWLMPPTDIAHGFREFREAMQQCRFRNCTHMHEPGCGLNAALEQGTISERRHLAFQRLVNEQTRLQR